MEHIQLHFVSKLSDAPNLRIVCYYVVFLLLLSCLPRKSSCGINHIRVDCGANFTTLALANLISNSGTQLVCGARRICTSGRQVRRSGIHPSP
jgi:hypothetical protein